MSPVEEKSALLERLENPDTIRALNRLLDRLESLERNLSVAEEAARTLPGVVGTVVDTVDELAFESMDHGVDLEERIQMILNVLGKLSHPMHLQMLNEFIDTAPTLLPMIQALKDLPGVLSLAVDTLDELYDKGEVSAIIDSGVFDPAALNTVGMMGKALVKSRKESKPMGFLGLMRSLRDPGVQRATGFLVQFAKSFGEQLSTSQLK